MKIAGGTQQAAAQRLLATYAQLAQRNAHLLAPLLNGEPPRQWHHYPEDDAIDTQSGYQWFYHSHSPQDRPGANEHGHFHLFARRKLWARCLRSPQERAFAERFGNPDSKAGTRHLLGIGLDAKGIPNSLFTVNSWVTGDLMLSAVNSARLLEKMSLNTGFAAIDAVIESVVALYRDEVRELLDARDRVLRRSKSNAVLSDESLEVLSSREIDPDKKIINAQTVD